MGSILNVGKVNVNEIDSKSGEAVLINNDVEINGTVSKGYRPGEVIEMLSGPCDGSLVRGISGDYTWPSVGSAQNITSTAYSDVTGSEIDYVPPSAASTVVYKLSFLWSQYDGRPIMHMKFYIDGNEVVYARQGITLDQWPEIRRVFEWPIAVGGVADANTGRQASWATAKSLKLTMRCYNTSYQGKIHTTKWWDGGGTSMFSMPVLTITAIA